MTRAMRRLACIFPFCLVLFAFAAPLLALNVEPVIVDLLSTGRRSSAIVSLQNTFSEAVPVEVAVHPVRVVDGELREIVDEEAPDLLVFPGQAIVSGGQIQAFRVQWVGDPAPAQSQHFYVTVSQLPVQMPEGQNVIQVLHRFKVLVSVGAPDASADLRVTAAEVRQNEDGTAAPVITVVNDGGTYGYVGNGRMTIVQRGADGQEVFRQTFTADEIQQRMGMGLIPSGQTRVLPINLTLPQAGGTLTVELASDRSS